MISNTQREKNLVALLDFVAVANCKVLRSVESVKKVKQQRRGHRQSVGPFFIFFSKSSNLFLFCVQKKDLKSPKIVGSGITIKVPPMQVQVLLIFWIRSKVLDILAQ